MGVHPLKNGTYKVSDYVGKANILNSFKSVFTNENTSNLPDLQQTVPDIEPFETVADDIEKLLHDLNSSKASGPDNISNKILKECSVESAPLLAALFNQSLTSGELPDNWTTANAARVIPATTAPYHWLLWCVNALNMSSTVTLCSTLNDIRYWQTASMGLGKTGGVTPNFSSPLTT